MSRVINYVPRVAIFLAGVAAALCHTLAVKVAGWNARPGRMKKSLTGLENRMQERDTAATVRFSQIKPS